MKAFIGLNINMGIVILPNLKDYWATDFLTTQEFFPKVFTHQRFLQIFWMLHFSEPTPADAPIHTWTQKAQNYLSYLSNKFLSILKPSKNIAIDESTVGYKGKISFKTYNPQKPRKWGLRTLIRPDLPFTSRIVLSLFENIRIEYPDLKGMHIYTDRIYTNAPLAQELSLFKCHLTGTINPRRKGNCEEIKKPKISKGETLTYRKNNILLLSWKDKRIVTMCSSWHDSSVETIERHTKQALEQIKKKTLVVSDYTQNMGGVDIADQLASTYSFLRKSLKWWRKLFFWGLEVSIINSYILYKENNIKHNIKYKNHLEFRKEIIMEFIKNVRVPQESRKRVHQSSLHTEECLTNKLHVMVRHPEGKTKDCSVCSNRKVKRGRKETVFCKTCTKKTWFVHWRLF
ncbi:hypothetical protein LAZ67_X001632 [Cordylochernes scorpioides]|uniref:PiggyBac transposable element-derived protein domain-containing protein n=1 Tax=Cordylochernes scorpioides TaxID=51811 RepID=A0ABY6LSM6_9ARAC|nr:hypothetical protein LAZ67_X001632 [Cordylochernes scorpioides]